MRTGSSRHSLGRIGVAASLAAVLVLGGCGGDGDETATDSDPPEQTTSSAEGPESEEPDETSSEVPDLCALLDSDDFESVTGARPGGKPESTAPTGAIRGVCTWSAEAGFPGLMIGAYNATDREATLDMIDSEPVDGLGTEADWSDQTGLMIVLEGRDWYLQVFAMGTDDDKEVSFAAAEIVLANLG